MRASASDRHGGAGGRHGEAGGTHGGARRGLCGAAGREERGWSQIEIAKQCADAKIACESHRIHNQIAKMVK